MAKREPITGGKVAPAADARRLNEHLYLALARHRRRTGEKQYEVASKAGVSPAELCRWVYVERQPSSDQASALAGVLHTSVAQLFPHLKDGDPAGEPGLVTTSAVPGRHDQG